MEFRHLNTFRAVAAELSFTRAAHRLGYVQSAVTSHIKELEDELGVRLFDRLGRRIMLTHAGNQLLGYADKILQLADEATAMIGEAAEPTGPVSVSAPEMLCAYRLPPVIRELHRQYPGIRLLFRSNPTGALDSSLRQALAHGDIDAAFVLDENLASTDSLSVEHLTSEPLVVVAAPQHPLAQAGSIGPADLDGVPVLLTDKGCGYRRVFERALHSAGARPAIAGEFTSGETVKRCAEAGTMIGVLAYISVTAELDTGRLVALPWNGPPLTLSSYLIAHQQRSISPAHAALRAATREFYVKPDTVADCENPARLRTPPCSPAPISSQIRP
jgi:DNA-binding transcriptional LysR family regulator